MLSAAGLPTSVRARGIRLQHARKQKHLNRFSSYNNNLVRRLVSSAAACPPFCGLLCNHPHESHRVNSQVHHEVQCRFKHGHKLKGYVLGVSGAEIQLRPCVGTRMVSLCA
jgi:hypothetical protein